jgi:hypothetical protein
MVATSTPELKRIREEKNGKQAKRKLFESFTDGNPRDDRQRGITNRNLLGLKMFLS